MLLFSVLYHRKVNIFKFWAGRQIKQRDITSSSGKLRKTFNNNKNSSCTPKALSKKSSEKINHSVHSFPSAKTQD